MFVSFSDANIDVLVVHTSVFVLFFQKSSDSYSNQYLGKNQNLEYWAN